MISESPEFHQIVVVRISIFKTNDAKSCKRVPHKSLLDAIWCIEKLAFIQCTQKWFCRCQLFVSVLGCSNLEAPPGGVFSREGDRGTLSCSDGQTWHLRCNGTTWIGDYGKCAVGKYQCLFI